MRTSAASSWTLRTRSNHSIRPATGTATTGPWQIFWQRTMRTDTSECPCSTSTRQSWCLHFRQTVTSIATPYDARAGDAAWTSTHRPRAEVGMSDPDKNRRLYEELREADLRRALPSALPGEAGSFDPPSLLSGPLPASRITGTEAWPAGTDQMELVRAFFEQATGPFFFAYGPTFADDDVLVVEWESFVFGRSGVVYNNQYCWWLSMGDDRIETIREYVDQHHAAIVIGPFGKWPQPQPATGPRRRHEMFGEAPRLAPEELDTSFEVVDEFELDPRMLCDVRPTDSPSAVDATTAGSGAKDAVRALRRARADGDTDAVSNLHAPGFRHHPIGERPLGWDHLPV